MDESLKPLESKQFRVIFPQFLNDQGNLFGGIAMQWMDEIAYIAASRYIRKKVVTVSVERVNFLTPVKQCSIIEITGKVVKIGSVKIDVHVDVYCEGIYSGIREKAIDATFIFAPVDENNNPILTDFIESNQKI